MCFPTCVCVCFVHGGQWLHTVCGFQECSSTYNCMYCCTKKQDAHKCTGGRVRLLADPTGTPGVEAPNMFLPLLRLNFINEAGVYDEVAWAKAPVWKFVIIDSLHTTLRVTGHLIQGMSKLPRLCSPPAAVLHNVSTRACSPLHACTIMFHIS